MSDAAATISSTLAASLAGYGSAPCIEFGGRWYTGDEIAAYADGIEEALRAAGVADGAAVGVVARNRPPHAAAVVGLLGAGRWVSMIYSFQSPEAIGRDIEALELAAVVADSEDWTEPAIAAAQRVGTAGIAVSLKPPTVELVSGLERVSDRLRAAGRDGSTGLQVLTSGTTGPPKRHVIPASVLEHTVASVAIGGARADDPPELMYWPLGGIGGVCQVITGAYLGKRIALLEKFSVAEWVRVVKTYGIARCGLQPAAVRMLLDADLPREDLASLEYVISAAGPLDSETRDAFEERYGVPVLLAYGATEFAGSVCTWTPELYREFGAVKRASSGRVMPNTEVRIIDPQTGDEVPVGEHGVLEARIAAIGPDWIRTNDLAAIDVDGFITLHGRADGAINRGGFKVLPEAVRRVLVSHPSVRDAAVVGVPDARLGEVPFAAVEAIAGCPAPDPAELVGMVRDALPKHCVPVAVVVVDELPRNPSLKVALREVAAMYADGTS
ncbi:acyl-coenzyme A synthetase/AMP-(fatty) acid ligase [Mycolicibacterium sp. BK556]|uniref:class I adenylate-forming enzyme family protein n=1 Tax=unclassified Mycolicibacterium TaxID=2636767 RepID=UPI0016073069|nr:acyl-coenzyme A synthetase/AMP-(fatty) acid ligase [Mycolicibacterium sp. BK556]MBB3631679.1 acyl-coenzyme A synthetase/AMP-(fatty) acid ligase [Mycolicibacterium sp. BK607]MBB3749683.1 acyl-coenzyme A synthetase/AMP-(fatty) acid ligase [Mycolicibacterium sp. BK634]